MAITFGWKGVVDTDLQFSEFYSSDHSVAIWFLLQYPLAYAGPIFSVNGTGTYVIGQGDRNLQNNAHLISRIERASGVYLPTPAIKFDAGVWYHLVLVRNNNEVKLFLNGQLVGSPLMLTNTNKPVGTLRLGRVSPGGGIDNQEAQFYGMMDELAVYTRALTSAEILTQFTSGSHLNGNEPGLLAGWLFSPTLPIGLPVQMQRPVVRSGQTALVANSTDRNESDRQLIPLPDQTMELPFLRGEAWVCGQGFASAFSHRGYAAFCWDFLKADVGSSWSDIYPNGSHKAPIYSTGGGEVISVSQSSPPPDVSDPETENMVWVRRADGFICTYLHLLKNSVLVSAGQTVLGEQIAQICREFRDRSTPPHLHLAMEPDPNDEIGKVTVPSCFSNYEARNANGSWSRVPKGIPVAGQVVRGKHLSIPERIVMFVINFIASFIDRYYRPRLNR